MRPIVRLVLVAETRGDMRAISVTLSQHDPTPSLYTLYRKAHGVAIFKAMYDNSEIPCKHAIKSCFPFTTCVQVVFKKMYIQRKNVEETLSDITFA